MPGGIDRSGSDLIYFTAVVTTGLPPELTLLLIFTAVAAVMTGPGIMVAECFYELPRLEAYRLDLLGSLLGTLIFTLLSFLGAPPLVWSLLLAAAVLVLTPRPLGLTIGWLTVTVVAMSLSTLRGEIWSPYYRIQLFEWPGEPSLGTPHRIGISANGVPHQGIVDLDVRLKHEPFYAIPYARLPNRPVGDVLIIGAGNGTDVALALQKGATNVDAVEIDPRILDIGVKLHPQRPYDDPRVRTWVGDGRAFLRQTDRKYDLVVFALPDSLTLVAGSNQLRLESYLFTQEALEAVRDVLRPGGAFAMYNYYREDWLIGRLARTAEAAFGHFPCVDTYNHHSAVIVAGLTPADQRCGDEHSASAVRSLSGPAPVHDDRPFLYLKEPKLPATFLLTIALILAVSVVSVRVAGGPFRRITPYMDLACLGAAFLLLETRAVTWSALLFGTTWVVNAIVFAGILAIVLLAVEVTRRLRRRPTPALAFGLLSLTLLVAWLVPISWLLSLPLELRVLAAVGIAFGPVFASNIIFATRFASTEDATGAFAANLLGAMVGGCLEYLTLVVGYPSLLLIAGLLYLAAFLLAPRVTDPA